MRWQDFCVSAVALASFAATAGTSSTAFEPFRPGTVRVGGEIGHRLEMTADKLLHKVDIEETFFRGFRIRKDVPDMWGGFSGWGMALDAIVKAAAHGVGGEEMVRFKERWVSETISTQTADGSISMFLSNPGVWDSHEQAYLIQALCNDHRWFGAEKSLAAARRLADYLIARNATVNLGLETAFVLLYEETGNIRYANWCRDRFLIEKGNDAYDSILPENGVVHVYTWLQRALAQMQYARMTGRTTPALEAAAEELFRRTGGDWLSVSGSMSGGPIWGELWDRSQVGLGKWGETCVSAYLLRVTAERMRSHPETRLGDLYERVLYNAFFGAQSHDGAKQRYFIPFNERGDWYERETYCCPNNLRRMMFEIPDAVFFRTDDGFALNLFAPSGLRTDGLEVSVKTDYPNDGKIAVAVKAAKAGAMRVRVPRWTDLDDAGTWRTYPYAAGETTVAFEFPMAVRFIRGRVAQDGKVAVMRGPVVYGLELPEKGWHGVVDAWEIDGRSPVAWKDDGVVLTMVSRKFDRARTNVVLRAFASDRRARTYFPLCGNVRTKDDELLTKGNER